MRDMLTRRVLFFLSILALVASLLTGCQMAPSRSARASKDWSRGVRVGTANLNNPVAMAVDEGGQGVHLLWVAENDQDQQILRYARLDASGKTVSETSVDAASVRPNQPRLARDAQGALHATWLARDGEAYRLYHALLDGTGRPATGPDAVSLPGVPVHSYTSIPSPDGGIEVFWGAIEGPEAGLYHARVASDGAVVSASRTLGMVGFDPSAARACDGSLHLVWKEIPTSGRQSISYGVFDGAARAIVGAHELVGFGVPTGLVGHRPALGIAGGRAYVFWSLERRGGGLTPPAAESQYLSFPLGHPEEAGRPRDVIIPEDNHPTYRKVSTAYRVSELASHEGALASRFVYLPSAASGEQDQLASAFAVQLTGRTKSIVQVALALWADGEMVGYQIVGQTDSISLRPSIEADARGDLHLNWIDTAGFGRYAIYYAATTEGARANLNRLGTDDVLAALFGVAWGLAQAASFFPIALLWLFPPMVVLALYAFIRAEDGLDRTGPRVMLVIGALMYIVTKYLFRPNWLAALPLPRETPPGLANALMYLAPILIIGVAVLATWLYIKRRVYASLLPAFAVFAVSDALLTLLIYVPGILAE
jgi:hypothetical protein